MGRPIWVTKAGDLGVIAEREFYNLRFDVIDPDNEPLTFTIVGGNLPRGLSLKDDGFIEGIPTVRKVFLRGVPTDVSEDVVSTFAVRVQTLSGDVSDRTFKLTVSGQDVPQLLTPAEQLGVVYDGEYFEYQLNAVDLDDETITWFIKDGSLPPGLTLDSATGLISGYVGISVDEEYGVAGWNITEWDTRPWDFLVQTIDKNYQFTVGITDGKDYAIRTYTIYVISNDSIDEDGDGITNEMAVRRRPVLRNPAGDLGIFLHDNYFSYKFDGFDFDGDPVQYTLSSDSIVAVPPNLTLGLDTGWLYGYIEPQALLEKEYTFTVRVNKRNYPAWQSDPKEFKITITSDLGKYIQWVTDSNLGSIENGAISEFKIEATNGLGRTLFYRLADNFGSRIAEDIVNFTGDGSTTQFDLGFDVTNRPIRVFVGEFLVSPDDYSLTGSGGVINVVDFEIAPASGSEISVEIESGGITNVGASGRLPQGLKLESDGTITGRVSFNGFTFDGANTTFDVVPRRSSNYVGETTFDQQYTFTVTAYDLEGDIETNKSFTIRVDLVNSVPFDNLYGVALLGLPDKQEYQMLFGDSEFFPPEDIYRPQDEYFGVSKDLRLLLASGIYPVEASILQSAMETNHYNKRIYLGDIKTARALNDDGTVRYEVVYLDVIDTLVTASGESIDSEIQLGNISISGGYDPVIYPNSLVNMRNAIYKKITQVRKNALPTWMQSKQENGTILGFVPAVVLCYTKPGKSKAIAFNLSRNTSVRFSDYEVILDRYIWDCNLSQYYDSEAGKFISSAETTFDRFSLDPNRYVLTATVDFAIELSYSQINGRTVSDIAALGGFDGVLTELFGKTIIFFKQQDYDNIEPGSTGWEDYNDRFDVSGFDATVFDRVTQVPGFVEFWESGAFYAVDSQVQFNGNVYRAIQSNTDIEPGNPAYWEFVRIMSNHRAGVWRTVDIGGGVLGLELVSLVGSYSRVDIRIGGAKYGGKRTYFDPIPTQNEPQPTYRLLEDAVLGEQTTFDENGTRFFQYKDEYAEPDVDDKYMKFPQIGVFE